MSVSATDICAACNDGRCVECNPFLGYSHAGFGKERRCACAHPSLVPSTNDLKMSVERFREIEMLMVDLGQAIDALVADKRITASERDAWRKMEDDGF